MTSRDPSGRGSSRGRTRTTSDGRRRLGGVLTLVLLTTLLVPLSPPPAAQAALFSQTVVLTEDGPSVTTSVLNPGGNVAFRNDTDEVLTVTALDGAIDSGAIPAGGSFHVSLEHPGTYVWHTEVGSGTFVVPGPPPPAGTTVASGLPDLPFPPRAAGDLALYPEIGLEVSQTRLLVHFAPQTTLTRVTTILSGQSMTMIGTIPSLGIVLASRNAPPTGTLPSHFSIRGSFDALRHLPEVRAVVYDHDVDVMALPAPSTLEDDHPASWVPRALAPEGTGSMWGHQQARVPAVWNLRDAIAARPATPSAIVAVDAGFEAHENLSRMEILDLCRPGALAILSPRWCSSLAPSDHGNQVLGAAGADPDLRTSDGRSTGTAGVDPFAPLYGLSFNGRVGDPSSYEALGLLLDEIASGRLGRVAAINLSFGLQYDPERWRERWAGQTCGPGFDDDTPGGGPCLPHTADHSRRVAEQSGLLMRGVIESYVARLDQPPLFVFAGGNDSQTYCVPLASSCAPEDRVHIPVTFAQPGAWASANWDEARGPNPILVVESLGTGRREDGVLHAVPTLARSPFSNVGGDVSAPGVLLLPGTSALGSPPGECPAEVDSYCVVGGTSFAAPFVAGVASLLTTWQPSLTASQLREHLLTWAVDDVTDGAAPRVDAYLALTALPGAAHALADMNDPSVDGNRRVVLGPDGDEQGLDTTSSSTAGAHSEPDGVVDLRDLRRLRDAWLLRCTFDPEAGCPSVIDLDGPADHPKLDGNLDGCIARVAPAAEQTCPSETTWSRFDLNGDGEVSLTRRAPVGLRADGLPAASPAEAVEMTDLEVLASQWDADAPGAHGVAAGDLADLMVSGDLTVFLRGLLAPEETGELTAHQPQVDGAQQVAVVDVSGSDDHVVLTVPAGEEVVVTLTPDDTDLAPTVLGPVTLVAGEDRVLGSCNRLTVEVGPDQLRPDGGTAQVAVTLERCGDDPVAGIDIALRVDPLIADGGASLLDEVVTTDAQGEAFTEIRAGTLPGEYDVVATLDLPDGTGGTIFLSDTARLRIAEPYQLDVLATTIGASDYQGLSPATPLGPSVAPDGSVAFGARLVGATSDTVMLATSGADPTDPTTAVDLVAGALPDGTIVLGSPQQDGGGTTVAAFEWHDADAGIWTSAIHRLRRVAPGVLDEVATGSETIFGGTGAPYRAVEEPAIAIDGTVVLRVTDGPTGDHHVARSSGLGPITGPVTPFAYPRVAGDGTVVTHATEQIGVTEQGLPILGSLVLVSDGIDDPRIALAASDEDGWTFLGRPAISDSGDVVVFVGDQGAGPGLQVAVRTDAGLGSWRVLGASAGAGRTGELGTGTGGAPRHLVEMERGANRPGVLHLPGNGPGLVGDRLIVTFLATPNGAGDGFTAEPGLWAQEIVLTQAADGIGLAPQRPVAVLQHGATIEGATVEALAIADPIARPLDATDVSDHVIAALAVTSQGAAVVRARWLPASLGGTVEPASLASGLATLDWAGTDPLPAGTGASATTEQAPFVPFAQPALATAQTPTLAMAVAETGAPILTSDVEVLDEPHLPAFVISARQVVSGTAVTITNRTRTLDGQATWAALFASTLEMPDLPTLLRPDASIEVSSTAVRSHTLELAAPVAAHGGSVTGTVQVVAGVPEIGLVLDGPWLVPDGAPLTLSATATGVTPLQVAWDLNGDGDFDRIATLQSGSYRLVVEPDDVRAEICGGACAPGLPYTLRAQVRELGSDERSAVVSSTVAISADAGVLAHASPGILPIQPGSAATLWVSLRAFGGFFGTAQVAIEGAPASWTIPAPRTVSVGGATGPFTAPEIERTSFSIRVPDDENDSAQFSFEAVVRVGEIEHRLPVTVTTAFGLVPQCHGTLVVEAYVGDEPLDDAGITIPSLSTTARTDEHGIARFEDLPITDGSTSRTLSIRIGKTGYHLREGIPALLVCGEETTAIARTIPWHYSDIFGQAVVGLSTAAGVVPTDEQLPTTQIIPITVDASTSDAIRELDEETGHFAYRNIAWSTTTPQGTVVQPGVGFTLRSPGFWEEQPSARLSRDGDTDLGRIGLVRQCTATVAELTVLARHPDGTLVPLDDVRTSANGVVVFTDEDGIARPDAEVPLGQRNLARNLSVNVQLPDEFPTPRSRNTPVRIERCDQQVTAELVFDLPAPPPATLRAEVTGTVTDEETGEPVVDVQVAIRRGPSGQPVTGTTRTMRTDEQGRFRFEDVNLGTSNPSAVVPFSVTASDPSGFPNPVWWASTVDITLQADEVEEVDLEILARRFGAVEGRVVDAVTGAPIDQVEVRWPGSPIPVVTGTDGSFAFDRLTLGERNAPAQAHFNVHRNAVPMTYWPRSSVAFPVVADEVTHGDLELLPVCDFATVRGVVVNAATLEPLEGVALSVSGTVPAIRTTSDADGRFVLEGIPPGTNNEPVNRTVLASREGFASSQRSITIFCGAEIIADFGQPSGGFGVVSGTVTDGDGNPVADAFVGTSWGDATTTDAAGAYLLDRVPLDADGTPRAWSITAQSLGRSTSGEVTVAADAPAVLDLVLTGEIVVPPEPGDPDAGEPTDPGDPTTPGPTDPVTPTTPTDPGTPGTPGAPGEPEEVVPTPPGPDAQVQGVATGQVEVGAPLASTGAPLLALLGWSLALTVLGAATLRHRRRMRPRR